MAQPVFALLVIITTDNMYTSHINCGVTQGFPALRKALTTHTREKISYLFTCVDIPNQLAASGANPPVSSVFGIFKGPSMFPSKDFFVFSLTDLHLPLIHL